MKQTTLPAVNNASSLCWELCAKREWYKVALRCERHPLEAQYLGENDETPLLQACRHRPPVRVVKALLAAYPNAANMPSNFGLPLHAACRFNASVSVLKELVKANPSAVGYISDEGSAVQVLCDSRDTIETNITAASTNIDVLWHADPSSLRKVNYSSVFWQKMLVLLEGAAQYRQKEASEESLLVLHAAVQLRCNQDVFEFALEKYSEQIKMRDCDGRFPLHIAVRNVPEHDTSASIGKRQPRERHMIVRLLEIYPVAAQLVDPNEIPGRFPIHTALSNGHEWHNGVKELFLNNPGCLLKVDPLLNIFPCSMSNDLDTTFQLLRNSPSALLDFRVLKSNDEDGEPLSATSIDKPKEFPTNDGKFSNPNDSNCWNPKSVDHFVFRCSVWGKNAIALRCSGPFLSLPANTSDTDSTKLLNEKDQSFQSNISKRQYQKTETIAIDTTISSNLYPAVCPVTLNDAPLAEKSENDEMGKIPNVPTLTAMERSFSTSDGFPSFEYSIISANSGNATQNEMQMFNSFEKISMVKIHRQSSTSDARSGISAREAARIVAKGCSTAKKDKNVIKPSEQQEKGERSVHMSTMTFTLLRDAQKPTTTSAELQLRPSVSLNRSRKTSNLSCKEDFWRKVHEIRKDTYMKYKKMIMPIGSKIDEYGWRWDARNNCKMHARFS